MTKIKVRSISTEYTKSFGGSNVLHSFETLGEIFEADLTRIVTCDVDPTSAGIIGPCDYYPIVAKLDESGPRGFTVVIANDYTDAIGDYYTRTGGTPMSRDAAMAEAEDRLGKLIVSVIRAKEVAHA